MWKHSTLKISEVVLYSNNIQNQKQFYRDVLGFGLLLDAPDRISFKMGNSLLTFTYKAHFKTSHLAFNIPSNQIHGALEWLSKRVDILSFENKPIVDFKSWNAESIYFYDADLNILEFIARKNLNITSHADFSSDEVLSISEMGMATTNIESLYKAINGIREIPLFDGDFSRFCALGNDEGLFILVDKNKKTWFPTGEEAYISDFIVKGDYNFAYTNGKIKELS
ncbi:MAG TPA: hypothetical protein VJ945_04185 [Flavobacteriaceae bacterium]|nr:hypothetical protein [Flavobacteriaceae bacterium]